MNLGKPYAQYSALAVFSKHDASTIVKKVETFTSLVFQEGYVNRYAS